MAKKKSLVYAGRPAFKRLQKHLSKSDAERGVEWEYTLGELVDRLCPRKKKAAYGQGSIQTLADELGAELISANRIWNARKLSSALVRAELEALIVLANEAEFGLTASHVLALATVMDAAARENLGVRCIKQKWSVAQLRREIHKVQGKQSGGGAKVREPISVDEALLDLLERSEQWLSRYEQAWFAEGSKGLSRPMSKAATDRLGNNLDVAIEVLGQLRQAADSARRRLRQQRTRTADDQDRDAE